MGMNGRVVLGVVALFLIDSRWNAMCLGVFVYGWIP